MTPERHLEEKRGDVFPAVSEGGAPLSHGEVFKVLSYLVQLTARNGGAGDGPCLLSPCGGLRQWPRQGASPAQSLLAPAHCFQPKG